MSLDATTQFGKGVADGEPGAAGAKHLDAFARLEAAENLVSDTTQVEEYHRRMLAHLDAAIQSFTGMPLEQSSAHLVKAGFLAHLALQDPDRRFALVAGALRHSETSLEVLQASNDLSYATISDWHARTIAVLLVLRELVDEPEPRNTLEGIMSACSQILGIALSEELQIYEEGRTRLAMAEILDALIAQEEDPSARRWMLNDRRELAGGAFEHLARTSHPDLAYEAWSLEHRIEKAPQGPRCEACGHDNLPGSRFCTVCGRPLEGRRTAKTATTESCPACGAANPTGHRFCTKCGARLCL